MLLVEHDQAERLDRREHGRARPHADARLAAAQAPPLLVALAGRQARVHDGDRVSEALEEAGDDLRRERDLGHHHDRPAPLLQDGSGRTQVDLGLARAGHAVQQAMCRATLRKRRQQRLQRGLLGGGELGQAKAARAHRQMLGAFGRTAFASGEASRCAGGQYERQRAREGGAVLRGDPLGERDEIDGHAELQCTQGREQALVGDLAVLGEARDDPEHLAAPERHDEHRADADALAQLRR